MEENNFEHKKKEIKAKLLLLSKKPLKVSLIALLFFAFALRFYYFLRAGGQPLWWDEACYGSLAKNLIYHSWDNSDLIIHEAIIRPPLFPLFWSLLLRIGIPEIGIKFLLEFIPSFFSVIFIYLLVKELYGKKTALMSAFIFSVLWIHLFYIVRLMTNVPALVFLLASMYFFIKSVKSDLKLNLFSISLFLLSLSTLIRYPNGIFFFIYLIFLILHKKLFLNKLRFWIMGIIGIFPLIVFFIRNKIIYDNIFPVLIGGDVKPTEVGGEVVPFAYSILNYIPLYLKSTFFIFFLIGIIVMLLELFIGYDFIMKSRKLKNHLFVILTLVFFYSFFIFYTRVAEDRWLLPTSFAVCCLAGFGLNYSYNFIKKYNKIFAIFFVFAILFFGAYTQIKFATEIIDSRKTSYLQIKQGFEWIKENSPEESVLIGNGIQPYAVYYSGRPYLNFPSNESGKESISQANYLIYHSFTPQSEYFVEYLQENQDNWMPIKGYFFDEEQKQPALIIYQNTNFSF